jgi:hypothetical protein
MGKDRSSDRSRGGPGSSHQDAARPRTDAKERQGPEPRQRRTPGRSRVSGGGGERDKHHAHDPRAKS